MKVFVADDSPHAQADILEDDFSFTIPGELVHLPPMTCSTPDCGCDRSMGGFVSLKATTRFIVRDLDMTTDTYIDLLIESLRAGGWVPDALDVGTATLMAMDHLDLAARLPEEQPLRILDDQLMTRQRES